MIATPLALALLSARDDLPGAFRHGQWRGYCYRDGMLRGMENEQCRADWSGTPSIVLERDAYRLKIISWLDRDARCIREITIEAARTAPRGVGRARHARRRHAREPRVPRDRAVEHTRSARDAARE